MTINNQKGYTFIELIIVVALFSIIASLIGGSFVLFSRAEARTVIHQKMVSDGRFILETIIREVRLGELDYTSYTTPISNPQSTLHLIDAEDNVIRFTRVSSNCPDNVNDCVQLSKGGSDAILSSEGVQIEYLNFYISPDDDPYTLSNGNYLADEQPRVTILLGLSSPELNPSDGVMTIELQGTASSKRYLR